MYNSTLVLYSLKAPHAGLVVTPWAVFSPGCMIGYRAITLWKGWASSAVAQFRNLHLLLRGWDGRSGAWAKCGYPLSVSSHKAAETGSISRLSNSKPSHQPYFLLLPPYFPKQEWVSIGFWDWRGLNSLLDKAWAASVKPALSFGGRDS